MKRIASVSIMILSLILLQACTQQAQQKPAPMSKASSIFEKGQLEKIKITADHAVLKSGSSQNAPIIKELKAGDIYDVVGESKDWYVVETKDGNVGVVEPSQAQPYIEAPSLEGQQAIQAKLTPNENEMLRLVNAERSKQGLNPLKLDMEITHVARLKSQDMIENNYFSHNSPTYGSPFDMMKRYGIKYTYAGENLAGNTSVLDAHESLMNSEGHRKNILNPNFTHIGIGVKEGSPYGKMLTQMFVGR